MKKINKTLIGLLVAVLLITTNLVTYANLTDKHKDPEVKDEKIEEVKEIKKNIDKDKNKLFDILEEKMETVSKKDKLPVIVVYNAQLDIQKKAKVKKVLGDSKPKYEYKTIPGIAVGLTRGQIKELVKLDFVKQIEYDLPVKAFNDTAKYWYGVDKAVTDFGVDGDRDGNPNSYSKDDIVVAVIDTGIDANHVDLDGGKVIGWNDLVNSQATPYDDHGHGTHCASISTGEGDGNPAYKGVAPGAALVGVKVLDQNGDGLMSTITAGIDWVVANKDVYGVEVINLSLGAAGSSDGTDSTSLAVNNAVDNGIVCLVAAGNEGPTAYTIGSPGAAEKGITVGAMSDVGELGYFLASFSSRGPTADGRIKPDVAAPGWYITAAEANSTNGYVPKYGTSMATPFTAGTAALMLDANPNLTPLEVKNIIMSTSKEWGPANNDNEYGNGRLDAYEAVKTAGSFSGTNITVPNHIYASETISSRRVSDYWEFDVTDTTYPIAITLVMPNWAGSRKPDFDVYLYDPYGSLIANGTSSSRQETVSFNPTITGIYTIRVYSYAGTGDYFFDLSVGGSGLILTIDN